MANSKKTSKKGKQEKPVLPENVSLNQLIFDCKKGKYKVVALTTRWAHEIKERDQLTLPPQDLMNKALKEILSGKVAPAHIESLPPVQKIERKPNEPVSKIIAEKATAGKQNENGKKKD